MSLHVYEDDATNLPGSRVCERAGARLWRAFLEENSSLAFLSEGRTYLRKTNFLRS
jgi:hypothetical protein